MCTRTARAASSDTDAGAWPGRAASAARRPTRWGGPIDASCATASRMLKGRPIRPKSAGIRWRPSRWSSKSSSDFSIVTVFARQTTPAARPSPPARRARGEDGLPEARVARARRRDQVEHEAVVHQPVDLGVVRRVAEDAERLRVEHLREERVRRDRPRDGDEEAAQVGRGRGWTARARHQIRRESVQQQWTLRYTQRLEKGGRELSVDRNETRGRADVAVQRGRGRAERGVDRGLRVERGWPHAD